MDELNVKIAKRILYHQLLIAEPDSLSENELNLMSLLANDYDIQNLLDRSLYEKYKNSDEEH